MARSGVAHGRILIVDDEPDTAAVIAELLERRGFVAEAVSSGAECLERVDRFLPDVVVTDLMMVGMSGIELCETLCATHPEVRSIVLTSVVRVDVAVSAVRAGAYDFLMKPVAVAALEAALARALHSCSASRARRRSPRRRRLRR